MGDAARRILAGGRFVRVETQFRNWVTVDGAPGPTGEGGFKAEPGRYHLYVSLACPWAHRTLIFRKLKKLTDAISVSIVEPHTLGDGWEFNETWPDHLHGKQQALRDLSDGRPEIFGPRQRAGAVGQGAEDDRLERIRRHHPHAQFRLRRLRRSFARLLSGAASRSRSMRSTPSSTRTSTTASTRPASPRARKPMRRRSAPSSIRSTSSTSGSTSSAS